jgi:hypothetical protein
LLATDNASTAKFAAQGRALFRQIEQLCPVDQPRYMGRSALMARHNANAADSKYPWIALGVAFGAAMGLIVGVIGWGGAGIALGMAFGAGIGVAIGAAIDATRARTGR